MKNLLVFVLFLFVGAVGFYGYYQIEQAEREAVVAQQRFLEEKALFEQAQAAGTISALNQFIAQHPESAWYDQAIYQRNKLAYQQAAATNDPKRLGDFIAQNPDSRWRPHAEQALKRLQRNQAHQQQLREQQEVLTERQRRRPTLSSNVKARAVASGNDDSRERVERALSIYQKQRELEASEIERKRKMESRANQQAQRCARVRDQLKQYERKRIRWYELDENGERVFLSKAQVEREQNALQQQYREFCE